MRQTVRRFRPVRVPPSGGSLEIGNQQDQVGLVGIPQVPPSGGSLEIGNTSPWGSVYTARCVPPSGGSLEIGNNTHLSLQGAHYFAGVPPSGGSLEIGNNVYVTYTARDSIPMFPLRGDP